MLSFRIKQNISEAQKGNAHCRELLIQKHRNFVSKTCSRICNRYLCWENDEELSIGLLAFNEAIDSYDLNSEVKFTSFAYTVIKRRLVDYFRSQAKYENELLSSSYDEKDELEIINNAQALANYNENMSLENLAYLIEQYKLKLASYNIEITDLADVSPKHRDTREKLQRASFILVNSTEMFNHLTKYKQLPIKELSLATGLSRKVLEKGRKYIIALSIILIEPQLAPLKQFSKFPMGGENKYGQK